MYYHYEKIGGSVSDCFSWGMLYLELGVFISSWKNFEVYSNPFTYEKIGVSIPDCYSWGMLSLEFGIRFSFIMETYGSL